MRRLAAVFLLLSGCGTEYVLGRLDSGRADSGPVEPGLIQPELGDTFLVQFFSGPSRWSRDGVAWAFDGWGADGDVWQPREGQASLTMDGDVDARPGPFTDGTRAVAGAFTATGRIEGPAADHTLEIVFRAASEGPLVESEGWGDLISGDGALVWRRGDAEVRSVALARDAWTHCGAAWSEGRAQIVCNGVAGAPSELPFAPAPSPGPLTVIRQDGRQLAWLAGHRARLDAEALRSRFLALTGLKPTVGNGQLRFPIRPSAAVLTTFEDGTRWLHRVGSNWPRVGCWTAEQCGLWSEPGRSPVPLDQWSADGLELLREESWRGSDVKLTEWRGSGSGPHALRRTAETEATRRVLSFFVSVAEPIEVVANMGAAQARFRVGGVAPEATTLPTGGVGRVEVWDSATPERAPLHRVLWSQEVPAGTIELSIELRAFASDPLPRGRIGPPQFQRSQAGLPLIDAQDADRVSYPGGANLPAGDAGRLEARFFLPWLPGSGQSTVANLSRQGRFGDQINIFIADEGQMLFWGLRDDDSRWGFGLPGSPARVDDGQSHRVAGTWGPSGVMLDIDGVAERQGDASAAGTHLGFDRIDLGNSLESSGSLYGGISFFRVSAP